MRSENAHMPPWDRALGGAHSQENSRRVVPCPGDRLMPIDFSKPEIQHLHRVLVDAYYREELLIGLFRSAGIGPQFIPFQPTVFDTWQAAMIEADRRMKLPAVLDAVLADERAATAHEQILAFRAGTLALPAPQPVVALRPDEGDRESLEKVMGEQPTFLDIAFLQAGLDAARAVARLRMRLGGRWYVGTGFLVGADLLLTNHHNLFDTAGRRTDALEIMFDYETTLDGPMREPTFAEPVLDSIVGELESDWAICRLRQPMHDRRPLPFAELPVKVDAWVGIIQHPSGLPKKIAVHHNTVTYADESVVHYLTDT